MVIGERIKKIFNWKIYLKNYPELFHAGIINKKKALEHWVNQGKSENKIAYIYLEDVNFDWILYLNNYPDLYGSGIDNEKTAWEHWITLGKKESRVCDKNIIGSMTEYATNFLNTQQNIGKNVTPPFLFRDFCLKNLDAMKLVEIPILPIISDFEAVFIEYKSLPHVEFIIRNAIYRLGCKWSFTVICGNLNHDFMSKMCATISSSIRVVQTNYDTMNETQYNRLLSSASFWNLLHGRKILIYKKDSFIFKSNIDHFLQWDYISAPFPQNQRNTQENTGNGGFSLRTRQVMLEVISKRDIIGVQFDNNVLKYMERYGVECPPEDMYFSKTIQELQLGRVADKKTSTLFSSNFLFNKESFGGYKFWASNRHWLSKLNQTAKLNVYKCASNIDKYVNYVKRTMKRLKLPITNVDLPSLYTRKNHFDIDFNFYLLSNRVDSTIHICNHFHDFGIYGLIYHPKQLRNVYPTIEFYSFLNTIFIKKDDCFYPCHAFVDKFVYKKSFHELKDVLIRKEHDSMSGEVSKLLILVFIGNETIGLNLIHKINAYKKFHPALNVAFCLNCNQNTTILKNEIAAKFKYYCIYVSNEMGYDITPTMLMYTDIKKNHPAAAFQHIIKLQTKSSSDAYNELTDFLLDKSLPNVLLLKRTNSNCIGHPGYYGSVSQKDDAFNQLLIQRHKPYIRQRFQFVRGTIFYCEARVFDVVLNFISTKNYHAYLLNNLYENNSINYDNSPVHHVERLFGIIRT